MFFIKTNTHSYTSIIHFPMHSSEKTETFFKLHPPSSKNNIKIRSKYPLKSRLYPGCKCTDMYATP